MYDTTHVLNQILMSIMYSLIELVLLDSVNIGNKRINNKSRILIFLIGITTSFLCLTYAIQFITLINFIILVLLSYLFYKRKLMYAMINASFILFVASIATVLTYLIVIGGLKLKIAAIQDNIFVNLGANSMILGISLLVLNLLKPLILKYKTFQLEKSLCLMVLFNIITVVLLLSLGGRIVFYLLEHTDVFYVSSQIKMITVLFIALLLILCVFYLYVINKTFYTNTKYKAKIQQLQMDSMTGAFKRETGLNHLKKHVEISKQSGEYITICFVDINNLKLVNDNFGHLEGDFLIKKIAYTIKSNLRKKDHITRMGGDEFLLSFFDCRIDEAKEIMERVTYHLQDLSIHNEEYDISISYGFEVIDPDKDISIDKIIELADKEMYKNKQRFKASLLER